jgi:hypothetical protein
VYDWDGRERFRLDYGVGAEGSPTRVNAIALADDSLIVADPMASRGLWVYSSQGELVRRTVLGTTVPIAGVARTPIGYAVSTIELDEAVLADSAYLAKFFDDSGTLLGRGCKASPVYRSSIRRRGMFAVFRGTHVVASQGGVLCIQAVEPGLEALSFRGEPRANEFPVPPFFRRGADVGGSLAFASIQRFKSGFTEHSGVFVDGQRALSVFTTHDSLAGQDKYLLWACRVSGHASCRAFQSTELPVALRGDSVAVMTRRTKPDAPFSVTLRPLVR